jgi:8-oxo-dGTP pyrophosphatase MutT (NUDIX family)
VLITIYDLRSKRKLKEDGITHAGGVVFTSNQSAVEYLIVRPSGNEFEWVLPKGHIKSGETPAQAALREVKEEAGVTAKILRRLGTVSFAAGDEDVRAGFYLMEAEAKGVAEEKRGQQWVSYDVALSELSHSQSQAMLKKGAGAIRDQKSGSRRSEVRGRE